MVEATGGPDGVRAFNLLDSAIESAFATFDGVDLYPSKEEKCAQITFSLIYNHSFVDDNKRIGMYILLTFMDINGINIEATDEENIKIGISVADDKMKH